MVKNTIVIKGIDDLPRAAAEFAAAIGNRRVFAFRGSMGAGKTTFINALCRALGVVDESTGSPTFAIVNEYFVDPRHKTPAYSGNVIYHFDFYRIDDPMEALDFGVEDYFDSGNLCLMEWPEKIESLLPADTVDVEISADPLDDSRIITF